jgi:hypothetical protein
MRSKRRLTTMSGRDDRSEKAPASERGGDSGGVGAVEVGNEEVHERERVAVLGRGDEREEGERVQDAVARTARLVVEQERFEIGVEFSEEALRVGAERDGGELKRGEDNGDIVGLGLFQSTRNRNNERGERVLERLDGELTLEQLGNILKGQVARLCAAFQRIVDQCIE